MNLTYANFGPISAQTACIANVRRYSGGCHGNYGTRLYSYAGKFGFLSVSHATVSYCRQPRSYPHFVIMSS